MPYHKKPLQKRKCNSCGKVVYSYSSKCETKTNGVKNYCGYMRVVRYA